MAILALGVSHRRAPVELIERLPFADDRAKAYPRARAAEEPALEALTPDESEAVAVPARGIVAKLLHDPIVRLKELSAPGTEDAHARLLATLFDLEIPGP